MSHKPFRSSWRRRLLRGRRQVESLGDEAEYQINRNFVRRLHNLTHVKRFVTAWVLLMVLLIGCVVVQTRALSSYYQTAQPVPGGIYIEGIVGNYNNANPIYATGQVNDAVSRLLFASLFQYNDKNQLVGDLASSYDVNEKANVYTVHLRPHLTWQDGQPLTAKDVVFTYETIQNPASQSPLQASWQGVELSAPNSRTVVFTLPNPLSSFPFSLTNGIIPKHILDKISPDQLRSATFNTTNPIGAGPFEFKDVQTSGDTGQSKEQQIILSPFPGYHAGQPKLSTFIIHTFTTTNAMLASYQQDKLTAMVGLTSLPKTIAHDASTITYNMPLTAADYVFFKNSSSVLSDKNVRRALVEGANVPKIIEQIGHPVTPVDEPLLHGQLGYDAKYQQPSYNPAAASELLNKAGWILGKDGIRYKKKQPLEFSLYAANTPQYAKITNTLKKQWQALGVQVQVYLQDDDDLQNTAAYHDYDALLYGISIGADPDVFVYWDSSQASVDSATRLNFSEYTSDAADAALEAGRTRVGDALRAAKYDDFLKAWQADTPALGLFQPRFLYVTRGQVFGLDAHTINIDTDRYNNVANWMIREVKVTNDN